LLFGSLTLKNQRIMLLRDWLNLLLVWLKQLPESDFALVRSDSVGSGK